MTVQCTWQQTKARLKEQEVTSSVYNCSQDVYQHDTDAHCTEQAPSPSLFGLSFTVIFGLP